MQKSVLKFNLVVYCSRESEKRTVFRSLQSSFEHWDLLCEFEIWINSYKTTRIYYYIAPAMNAAIERFLYSAGY